MWPQMAPIAAGKGGVPPPFEPSYGDKKKTVKTKDVAKRTPPKRPKVRTQEVKIRATVAEKRDLKAMADSLGMTTTELILTTVLKTPSSSVSKRNPARARHLAKIGNNINQMARACNYCSKASQTIDLMSLTIELRKLQTIIQNYADNDDADR
jgi:hypothetical protein